MNLHTSPGPDKLPSSILKECADELQSQSIRWDTSLSSLPPTLLEIGDILRPRSIWHAVSNYQDGGIKKAVRRKNKDWNDTLSKDLNQFNFFFEVVNTKENEKGETRVRAPVRMTIFERRNNFVSCVTWQSKNNFQKSGPTVHLASNILYNNNHIWSTYL